MSHYSFQKLVFILLALILFAACSVEHKIAKSYVKKENKGAVLVLSPDTVFLLNARDTAAHTANIDSTNFLRLINENALVGISLNLLKKKLHKFGFRVYDENSLNEFLQQSDSSYVFKLSQVELEEGIDYNILKNYKSLKDDSIKGINYFSVNAWFEFGRKNILNEKFPILYCSLSLEDQIVERYYYYVGDYSAVDYIKTLEIQDFYQLPEYLGETYAEYFYDYVMNIYILENIPEDYIPSHYYHFDHYYKVLSPLLNQGEHFIELKEEL